MLRNSLFIFACLCIATYAYPATQSEQKSWSLHDCMAYAVSHSPRSKIQELENDNAAKDHRAAILGFLPSVSGSVNAFSNFGRTVGPDNTYIAQNNFSNSYGLSGSLPLFNGFSVVNNLRVTKIAQMQGTENAQLIADDIALETMQAYANVHYYHGMVNLAREQLDESKNTLYQAKVQEELGLKGNADVLEIEAKVAGEDFNLTRQQNLYAEAMLQLKEAMFYPIGDTLRLDTSQRWAIAPLAPQVSADSLYRAAVEFLPAARIAAMEIQMTRLSYQTAKWKLLPSLSLSGGFSTGYTKLFNQNDTGKTPEELMEERDRNSFRSQFKNRAGENVGVTLSIPIFRGYTQQTTVAKQRNQVKIDEQKQSQKLHEIESEIQRAVQDMDGTAKEYVQCVKQVLAQESAYTAVRRKYEEGLASVLDMQTSSNQLLVAKAARLNAMLQYLIKRRVVEYYRGTPYLEQDI